MDCTHRIVESTETGAATGPVIVKPLPVGVEEARRAHS